MTPTHAMQSQTEDHHRCTHLLLGRDRSYSDSSAGAKEARLLLTRCFYIESKTALTQFFLREGNKREKWGDNKGEQCVNECKSKGEKMAKDRNGDCGSGSEQGVEVQ